MRRRAVSQERLERSTPLSSSSHLEDDDRPSSYAAKTMPTPRMTARNKQVSHRWLYNKTVRGLLRDVVYISWRINSALLYEPKCGEGVAGSQPMSTDVQEPKWTSNSNSIFNLWIQRARILLLWFDFGAKLGTLASKLCSNSVLNASNKFKMQRL